MRPEDISEEAWNVAEVYLRNLSHLLSSTEIVARVLLAERERCAKLAEQGRVAWYSSDYQGGFNDACNTVARAIRNGEAPVEPHTIPHHGTVKS